jgi:glycosyltransferase involved in cell wall biosynthesis
MGALIRLLLRKPITFVCHNVLPHERHWYDSLFARLALRWGTSFIVQSEEEKELLFSLLSDVPVSKIPLPVFDMFADERVPKAEARRELGLPLDVPILLFFGIVREYKGLKDLLAALPKVEEALGKVVLIVAGEFWEDKEPYIEMIDHLGLAGSVIIEDRYILNEEVPVYFSAADLVVAPYRRVTGSAAARMAQGFAVPVITTWKEGQAQDAVEDRTRLLVSPGDVSSLETTIIRFFARDRETESPPQIGSQRRELYWDDLVRGIEETTA